jgi:hypothetical protein
MSDVYTVVVSRTGFAQDPWSWEICRNGEPLPARVRNDGYRTEYTVRSAGDAALRSFLAELVREQYRAPRKMATLVLCFASLCSTGKPLNPKGSGGCARNQRLTAAPVFLGTRALHGPRISLSSAETARRISAKVAILFWAWRTDNQRSDPPTSDLPNHTPVELVEVAIESRVQASGVDERGPAEPGAGAHLDARSARQTAGVPPIIGFVDGPTFRVAGIRRRRGVIV